MMRRAMMLLGAFTTVAADNWANNLEAELVRLSANRQLQDAAFDCTTAAAEPECVAEAACEPEAGCEPATAESAEICTARADETACQDATTTDGCFWNAGLDTPACEPATPETAEWCGAEPEAACNAAPGCGYGYTGCVAAPEAEPEAAEPEAEPEAAPEAPATPAPAPAATSGATQVGFGLATLVATAVLSLA